MTTMLLKLIAVVFVLQPSFLLCSKVEEEEESRRGYIIHMEKTQMPTVFTHHSHWYTSSLKSVSPQAQQIYSYNTLIHGFSAKLTPPQATSLRLLPGVLSVLPEVIYHLHTTRSPHFLRLSSPTLLSPALSSALHGVVVALLDTGVWPESPSFSDKGLPPPPPSWRGACLPGLNFSSSLCNRKLLGARFFSRGYQSALGPLDPSKESLSCRDDDGHGTHTASTAAGAAVRGANLFGHAAGVARGMAVQARVAVYKVCWLGGCFNSDILAAMEAAVDDGADVISMSLGGGMNEYYKDSVAIGAFSAMEKGVFIACSAGNSGPARSTLSNVAPWITTVGAGTLDRDFPARVRLGNGLILAGVSLYSGRSSSAPLPLVYAGNVSGEAVNGNLCLANTLNSNMTRGRVVFCDRGINPRVQKGVEVRAAGGKGMILGNTASNGEELVADAHLLPAAAVGERAATVIKKYILSSAHPTVTIEFRGTLLGVKPSPVVAAFSSRGPNSITSSVLKPDMIAPGVNILAAWSGAAGPSGLAADTRRVEYNIISGTSMSCPHVGGLAALLKGAHPEWSPAAVRSALMTTAYTTYRDGGGVRDAATGEAGTPFDYGSGHVDPVSALDPGLVYDMGAEDYLMFLCALNYSGESMTAMAKRRYECGRGRRYESGELNYPSFASEFEAGMRGAVVRYKRRVTSVGGAGVYGVRVWSETGSGVRIQVVPTSLNFTRAGEVKGYVVTVTAGGEMPSGSSGFARIEWSDGVHSVKSPMAFTWV